MLVYALIVSITCMRPLAPRVCICPQYPLLVDDCPLNTPPLCLRLVLPLSQADLATEDSDPDTLPQKYYTVMIERIPANLRSAEKLFEYFEELFPGTDRYAQLLDSSLGQDSK